MDIGFCILDTESKSLQFAGAYHSLFIIRKGELIQLIPDKMPIGIHFHKSIDQLPSFNNQVMGLEQGDILYMFSDGYIDQIGGPQNRKFLSKRFKDQLMDLHKESLTRQKELLLQVFNDWKEDREQLDDILVIGMKV